jgi:hypothetical protein
VPAQLTEENFITVNQKDDQTALIQQGKEKSQPQYIFNLNFDWLDLA